MAKGASAGPSYGLNTHLSVDTPEPPVPVARAWAAAFPSPNSPLVPSSTADSQDQKAEPTQPLLNLAQGVPGHEPHTSLLDRMQAECSRKPMDTHGYGGVFGDESLRVALAADLCRVYGDQETGAAEPRQIVRSENVAITAGCNLAAAVVFHALAAPGEAIVLPTPWYFNHQMTLASLAIEVVPLETKAPGFLPSAEDLEKLLEDGAKKIKAVVLITPNNPTGAIYPPALLTELAQICRKHKVACVVDETYRDFLLNEGSASVNGTNGHAASALGRPHMLFADQQQDWQDCIISLHSFSKSYAIPGHRLGAIVAHPSLLITQSSGDDGAKVNHFGSLAKSLDNMQICPPRTDTQRAVAQCIADDGHRAWRLGVATDLRQRHETFQENLLKPLLLEEALEKLGLEGEHREEVMVLCNDGQSIENESSSPESLGWVRQSAGGYYAYVRHPFADTPSETVARGLALLCGIVVLPGSFFRPASEAKSDTDLRFSIANVESSRLDTLGARLVLLTHLWKTQKPGWGL